MYSNVSLVLTSCNRLDLLEKTINSIPNETLKKIPKKILIDDSADIKCFNELKKQNDFGYLNGWDLILNEMKLGQAASIDRAYSEVKTEYVFHCEDDWHFNDGHFIDKSLKILDKYDNVLQVTFRYDSPHQLCEEIYEENTDFAFQVLVPGYNGWPGFTYNPNIFRFSAYQKIKPVEGKTEKEVGIIYNSMGWHTVALRDKTVRHIGDGRHVYDSINCI